MFFAIGCVLTADPGSKLKAFSAGIRVFVQTQTPAASLLQQFLQQHKKILLVLLILIACGWS